MIYSFIIYPDGSYIITSKYKTGSITWTINIEDVIEKSRYVEKYVSRQNNAMYIFPTYRCIRGAVSSDLIYHKMFDILFKYGKQLRGK